MASEYVRDFKLNKIAVPEVKIRKAQTDSEHFHNTKRSIALHGVKQPTMLTLAIDGVPHPEGLAWLVDGLQRTEISQLLNLETIPAEIYDNMTQEELLLFQDTLNSHRIPQKPKERLQHFKRLMNMHPEWTIEDLSNRICEKIEKVKILLKLHKLTPEALDLVDNGTIKLTAGAALASLPLESQNEHLQDAATLAADTWVTHAKSLKDAYKKTGKGEELGLVITPHPKKRNELIAMWQDAQHKYETKGGEYFKGRVEALAETLQVDDATINAKKEEKEQLKLERAEKAAENRLENAQTEIQKVLERKKKQNV